ncbi:ABC transporter permease [Granulosicoccus antarcticus]|uniref:Ribose import permease protein RbsC n=1 Tax=Granulosicoccus antarcticus IMCC3135 TaxID=1192854 RepID=A0A2Z2NWH7_9GAMM|nr:ABC transporter permease [Granulosicoccus antarcticus]ASJ75816.1 Ribose import permease protein RbsC [Granulosicoccus antarcticus IMCC3135]
MNSPPHSPANQSSPQLASSTGKALLDHSLFALVRQTVRQSWGLIAALLLLVLIFSLASPYFFNTLVLERVLTNASFTLIMATGMTLVIATGGIDVSVGAILALTSMVTATLMISGMPVLPAVAIGLMLGALIGAINGTVISFLKIQPFIATLAMLSLARGLTLIISDGAPASNLPESFASLFKGESVVYLGVGVLILTMLVMHTTRLGIQIRAVGGNETTCFICGVRVNALRIGAYVFQGLLAVLAGFTLTASFDSAEPTAGLSTEWLEAIAAPIIGGNTMAGGRARLFGTLMGCLILATMRSGLNISGVPTAWQQVAIGGIIVGAVALDVLSQRKRGQR